MNKQNRLLALFNIESGEGQLVGLLLSYSFFIGFARLLINTSAGTLLRDRYGEEAAQLLPYVYIGAAIAAPLTGFLYSKLEERLSFSKLLAANFSFLLVTLSTFYLLLTWFPQAKWPAIAFYIWYYVLYALIMLAFWGLAGRLLDIRQSKRLFGLVGSGLVVAMIISGFLVRPLVQLMGTSNLLLLAAGGIFACLPLMFYLIRAYNAGHPVAQPTVETERLQQKRKGYVDLLKNRYILLMVGLTALNLVAYFFIDNAFYDQVYFRFPERTELASFLGEFLAISSLFNLGSRAFATGKVITRYGLLVGLLVLPIVLTLSAMSVAVVGTFYGTIPLLFWLVVTTRLLFKVLGDAIDKSAFSILYQVLPTRQRLRVQTLIISLVEPVAGGVAGVVLLILSFEATQIFYIVLFILAGWIGVAVLVSREYKETLIEGLSQHKLGQISLSAIDKAGMTILEQKLTSENPGLAIYALDTLLQLNAGPPRRFLRKALSHPAPPVRQNALNRIEELGITSMLREVKLKAQYETSVPVQAAAIRTWAKLSEADVADEVAPYLEDSNSQLRKGAMVGLLRSGGIEGILLAGEKLIRLVDSPQVDERIFAAQVLGDVGQPGFFRPLLKLLQDEDLQVRRAALVAAGKIKNPRLWPLVVKDLKLPQLRSTAISTLVVAGESVLPHIKNAFAEASRAPDFLIRLARICGQIQGDEAVTLLQARLDYPDNDVRHQVMLSLSRCGYRVQGQEAAYIQQKIQAELENAVWILAVLVDIGDYQVVAHLRKALLNELKQTQARIFLLLSFVYDPQAILHARNNLTHHSKEQRAYALEVIDNTITSQKLKASLFPLLEENLTLSQRLEQLKSLFPTAYLAMDRPRPLHEVVDKSAEWISAWGRACALYALAGLIAQNDMGQSEQEEATEIIVSALDNADPLLRETALWSLFNINRKLYQSHIGQLQQDANPKVAGVARQLATAQNGEATMQSTFEKVIILKSISIFAEIPEEILATIAANLKEIEVMAEEPIVNKGDIGRSMYIIISGRVRIHDGEKTLGYLGEQDIFGELATLDAEPRTASVTAIEDTSLFVLNQDILYELMADYVEVARGIIQVLTRRVRTLIQSEESSDILADIDKKSLPVRQHKDVLIDGILDKLTNADQER